jgi:hypothetical protein
LTHGADWHVLREIYHRPFGSAGAVSIEDNVFVGIGSIILKGVTIGENSIVGAGSVVTKNVPAGAVVAGNPARMIMTIDEYEKKRERQMMAEACEYASAINKRYGRLPVQDDFKEYFFLFLERNPEKFGRLPVEMQCGRWYNEFLKSRPRFGSFEEFLRVCGLG